MAHKLLVGATIEDNTREKAVKLSVNIRVVFKDGRQSEKTWRIWLPRSVMKIEDDAISVYPKFIQMKEEEIAKMLDAKLVGIKVVEDE